MDQLFNFTGTLSSQAWQGDPDSLACDTAAARALLLTLDRPLHAVRTATRTGLTLDPGAGTGEAAELLASAPALPLQSLGDPGFRSHYGTRYACYAGSMANGISSAQMVIALGRAGFMGSFGAAGLSPQRVETAIQQIQAALPAGPYAFNLINSPNEPALEQRLVDLYISSGVRTIEASAFVDLSIPLVHYRVAGLEEGPGGIPIARNRIIAKLSRKEVARRFMEPAPQDILDRLVADKRITPRQAELAHALPMSDDVTVEADSGGHTDNRPLVGLLPTMLALRDEIQAARRYPTPVRIGAGGGISTPAATLATFAMGAAYVVTGSVNQACVESGACEHTKKLLAQADMADVAMAPSADMFEMGVKVQVLKRGTLFPMRAQKLYELYSRYNAIEEIPAPERQKLEQQVFKRSLDEIWAETVQFFTARDPAQLERANRDPHQKMALVFRWYLGLSSRWSVAGEKGREMDYQVWCGPAMGTFNDWTRGTYLAEPANRHVVDVNLQLLAGCAYLWRVLALRLQGVSLPPDLQACYPAKPLT
jgi:trans-AT polyketide synthase, acyltransferase and oxidoreductase domains